MKKFHLVIDIVFFAENLDSAFEKLSEHFRQLKENTADTVGEFIGEVHLHPMENEEECETRNP